MVYEFESKVHAVSVALIAFVHIFSESVNARTSVDQLSLLSRTQTRKAKWTGSFDDIVAGFEENLDMELNAL